MDGLGGESRSNENIRRTTGAQPVPKVGDDLLREIEKAQLDAVLLLNFVSERKEHAYKDDGEEPTTNGRWTTEDLLTIVRKSPTEIRDNAKDWAVLLAAVDHLADLARPATVDSIRITRRYVEGKSEANLSAPGAAHHARLVRWFRVLYLALGGLGILAVFGAMFLLHHVFTGQLILKRLAELGSEQTKIHLLQSQAFPTQEGRNLSCQSDRSTLSAMQRGVCDSTVDLKRKMDLTYLQLEVWNRTADEFYGIPNMLFRPSIGGIMSDEATMSLNERDPPPPDAERKNALVAETKKVTSRWERTELRTEAMLAGLSNYGIPTILGFIGASVFVFRRLSTHLDEWTLEGRERILICLRPMLGLILGGLVSLIFEARGSEVGDFKFSLGFLAFVGGYSVQYIFDLLDGFVMRTTKSDVAKATRPPLTAPVIPPRAVPATDGKI